MHLTKKRVSIPLKTRLYCISGITIPGIFRSCNHPQTATTFQDPRSGKPNGIVPKEAPEGSIHDIGGGWGCPEFETFSFVAMFYIALRLPKALVYGTKRHIVKNIRSTSISFRHLVLSTQPMSYSAVLRDINHQERESTATPFPCFVSTFLNKKGTASNKNEYFPHKGTFSIKRYILTSFKYVKRRQQRTMLYHNEHKQSPAKR